MSEHAQEHKHHVIPLWIYLAVGGALLFLTVVTVAATYVNFSAITGIHSLNFIVAMLIASTKATLVVLFFMHLLYDNKFFLFTFLSGILCLLIFIVITMFDTDFRGRVNPEEKLPIVKQVPADKFVAPAHHGEENHHGEETKTDH